LDPNVLLEALFVLVWSVGDGPPSLILDGPSVDLQLGV